MCVFYLFILFKLYFIFYLFEQKLFLIVLLLVNNKNTN